MCFALDANPDKFVVEYIYINQPRVFKYSSLHTTGKPRAADDAIYTGYRFYKTLFDTRGELCTRILYV